MIKEALKRNVRKFGIHVSSVDRLGVELELDLARLTNETPLRTIFDVGGNFGQTALRLHSAFPAATIFTFEPVPASFGQLESAIAGLERIRAFNIALGDRAGRITMNITGSAGSNTAMETSGAVGGIEVSTNTLDAVTSQHGVKEIDLLKIDVEGFELQVLKGAEQLLSSGKIRFIFAECVFAEDSSPHTSFFALHERLERHGFCFVTYYAESFNLALGCAMGNVLYALKSALPNKAPGRVRNVF